MMTYNSYIFWQFLFTLTFAQLPQSIVPLLPTFNPATRCHDFALIDEDLTFAVCLQRGSNKQHPFNLYTSPSFCSMHYPPYGHLIDLFSLSSSTVDLLLHSLTHLLTTKDSYIALPEPNFLWIGSNFTQNLTDNDFWCPNECQGKNQEGKFLIVKTRCQYENNSKPCITRRHTHWDRAPFICLTNQTKKLKKQIEPGPIHISPSYSNDTAVFYDSTPCVIVRTRTHQYAFCFRRQSCPQTLTSAFCTTKSQAYHICQEEQNGSNLLTIENDDEYQLINDIVTRYSNETLVNSDGLKKNKYISRAQWVWIDGIKGLNDIYRWNVTADSLTPIPDRYWCNNMTNCSGGKGRDHVVLNIICQSDKNTSHICLTSRRQSEPGPFICKRTLKENEEPVSNYTFLRDLMTTTTISPPVIPIYEKNLTSIYYDEQHCLTVQTRSHLYTFCLRRQNCTFKKAYCTKWSQAQQDCTLFKNQARLLTIDNEQERTLVTDMMKDYLHETRLSFNGSSYPYYELADFAWIDGIRQADNRTYLWKNELESIPENLWCPRNECNSMDRERVMLNLLCNKNNSLICLGTRIEWKPAPYVCKRIRPKDQCPILFDGIRSIHSNEMLIVTVNRTVALIKCKHPEYNTEIKVEYQCNIQTNQWKLIYENDNFTCPNYDAPPMAISINDSRPYTKISATTSTRASYLLLTSPNAIKENDCSKSDLSSLISSLPTQSYYIYPYKLTSYSSLYYDMKLTCYFNHSIQIIYRCDLSSKQWMYVYGNTNHFQRCHPPCANSERIELLNKYFSQYEQSKIRAKYIAKRKSVGFRCFNTNENRWKSISYKCGTMTLTKYQWFKLHSCFQPIVTTTTTELPPVMVSMSVTQLAPSCPPVVIHGSPCEHGTGQYIFDINGCARKICPSLSRLCYTIRCPSDRTCRVLPCKSCIHTEYLQAVCEYPTEPSLCELERQLLLLNDSDSINRWIRQTTSIIQRYANEQQQRLRSPWPVLTIN